MGKPFGKELIKLESTITWINEIDISSIRKALLRLKDSVYIIGSGGSFSACSCLEQYLNSNAVFAKPLTPLEFLQSVNIRQDVCIIFISASGKNKDIVFAFKEAIKREVRNIISITMRSNNPIQKLSETYSFATCYNFNLPSKKDGFLATNSLLGYFTLFYRIFESKIYSECLPNNVEISDDLNIISSTTLVVLYSVWSKAVALDIESKCSEAGLVPVIISDYRNFGHGRHNWFDKNKNSIIVSLTNQEDKKLSEKTLNLLPDDISKINLLSTVSKSGSCVQLLVKSFYLIHEIGKILGIDPGRPGVPNYGRKLYNLSYIKLIERDKGSISQNASNHIKRKFGIKGFKEEKLNQYNAYKKFLKKIESVNFGMIVFDYDGTLIPINDKLKLPSKVIQDSINLMLSKGILIGFASGRGKSLRRQLQKFILKKYWKKVIVGYYNGSSISNLADNNSPNKTVKINKDILKVYTRLEKDFLTVNMNKELRPNQITIIHENSMNNGERRIRDIVRETAGSKVVLLESSHSIDIIPYNVSKTLVLKEAIRSKHKLKPGVEILKVGDRGKYPGNDYDLLKDPFGISVDEVSTDPNSCWNLAPIGISHSEATEFYLGKIIFAADSFKLKF